jgi:hypothetical protein
MAPDRPAQSTHFRANKDSSLLYWFEPATINSLLFCKALLDLKRISPSRDTLGLGGPATLPCTLYDSKSLFAEGCVYL